MPSIGPAAARAARDALVAVLGDASRDSEVSGPTLAVACSRDAVSADSADAVRGASDAPDD